MTGALQPYRSAGGRSGVTDFAIFPDAILLLFQDGSAYLYDTDRPGPEHVRRMTALAQAGRGLTTYVNRHVRGSYADSLSVAQVQQLRDEAKA